MRFFSLALLLDAVVVVNPCLAGQFAGVFNQLSPESTPTSNEEISSCFHSTCCGHCGSTKTQETKTKPEPGLNGTGAVRRCVVEHKWKKQTSGLFVSASVAMSPPPLLF